MTTEAPAHRQYLRVKRRRTDAAPSALRLEGVQPVDQTTSLDQAATALSQFSFSSTTVASSSSRKRPTTAVLRRVTNLPQEQQLSPTSGMLRVVDAILAHDQQDDAAAEQSRNKRRRLTLVESKTVGAQPQTLEELMQLNHPPQQDKGKKKKKKAIRVLNPEERMVDDSLKLVYQGDITPRQHYDYISSQSDVLMHRRKHWLTWSNAEMGNLLHSCALWNDAELAAQLLELLSDGLGTQLDGDGRTPYQVAELMGHDTVQQVLEAFGVDTTNYVYDLYCIDTIDSTTNNNTTTNNMNTGDGMDVPIGAMPGDDEDFTCQLHGGYSYWDDGGHLMLETVNGKSLLHDTDDKDKEDDDEDPDDEAWEGNDYPDEEVVYWGGGGLGADVEDSDNEDDNYHLNGGHDNTFRQYADNGDGDFDAAYGIYGQDDE